MESEVLSYFEAQAKSGDWESLYNPQNPKSYPFIVRLQKTLNLLENIDNKKICDLGCGTGVLIPFILKKNGNYTGIDFSKRMLDTIRSKYQKEINDKKVDLLLSDFKNLDQTRKYDILIGLGFMEYFDEPKKIVKKLYNIIKPNCPNLVFLDGDVLRDTISNDLGHSISAPKLPESQIKLILRDLDQIEGFYDKKIVSNWNVRTGCIRMFYGTPSTPRSGYLRF